MTSHVGKKSIFEKVSRESSFLIFFFKMVLSRKKILDCNKEILKNEVRQHVKLKQAKINHNVFVCCINAKHKLVPHFYQTLKFN